MPLTKLPVVSGIKILKALGKAGFELSMQKGSHIVMTKYVGGQKIVTVVPLHKEIDPGTLLAIIAQSGIAREEFLELL